MSTETIDITAALDALRTPEEERAFRQLEEERQIIAFHAERLRYRLAVALSQAPQIKALARAGVSRPSTQPQFHGFTSSVSAGFGSHQATAAHRRSKRRRSR